MVCFEFVALPIKHNMSYGKYDRKLFNTSPLQSAGAARSLSLLDEFFLVLVRLRLGLLKRDLADRFGISESSVSRICKSWMHLSGAPDGGVPQNICSAEEIQLAGKLIIATDFSWEFRTFSSISSRAGWIFQKTERDWKNTLVGRSCKRHFV